MNVASPKSFAAFSTSELLAEIERRREARVHRRPIVRCDLCKNFVPATETSGPTYNPCAKGHEMSFRAPEPDDGPPDSHDDWGHYRRVCADRDLG